MNVLIVIVKARSMSLLCHVNWRRGLPTWAFNDDCSLINYRQWMGKGQKMVKRAEKDKTPTLKFCALNREQESVAFCPRVNFALTLSLVSLLKDPHTNLFPLCQFQDIAWGFAVQVSSHRSPTPRPFQHLCWEHTF